MNVATAGDTKMTDVANYAPIRVFLSGFARLLFAAMLLALAVLIAYLFLTERNAPNPDHASQDIVPTLPFVSAGFGLVGLLILSGAVGRIVSAFARGCYFRAGIGGIELRMPRRRWYGRFHLGTWRFRWEEIAKLVHFTTRINGIPSSRELRIHLNNGQRLDVERFYFSQSVATIQYLLLQERSRWEALAKAEAERQSAQAHLREAQERLKEAREHEAKGNLEAAVGAAVEAVHLDPESATLRNWLGHFLVRQGRFKDAVVIIESAVELAPDVELYHYALGNALLQDGRFLGAVTALRRALELDPNDAHAHHALGIALARSGDLAGARAEVAILEKLEPARAERLRGELPPA